MPENPYEKLENFTSVITADAVAESKQIYDEIRQESEQVLTAAEDEALGEMFRYIKTEVSTIRTEAGRRVSRVMMDNKRKLYTRRDAMTGQVIAEVTQTLRDFVATPGYADRLERLLTETLNEFKADTVVYLRKEDMGLADRLTKLAGVVKLEFRQGSFRLGGLKAVCPSKKLQIDECYDTTLDELHGRFAELFGLELAD